MKNVILLLLVICAAAAHSQTTQSDTVWSKFIGSEVKAVKFSPDGNNIYVGAAGRKPFVLSTENGEIIREYEQSFSSVTAMDLSKDGEMLVVGGGNNDINIIETLTGNLIQKFNITELTDKYGYIGIITSITISIDKKKVYCVIGGHDENGDTHHSSLIAWNITENKLEKIENFGYLYRAYLSPTENCIALCFNNPSNTKSPIIIINVDSWQRTNLGDHTNRIQDIAFSPDGSLLASGDMDGVLKIWDVKEKKLIREIKEEQIDIFNVCFIGNDFILTDGGGALNHYVVVRDILKLGVVGKIRTSLPRDIDVELNKTLAIIALGNGLILYNYYSAITSLQDIFEIEKRISSYPNPVKSKIDIKFTLPIAGKIKVSITDINTKEIIVLFNDYLEQGEHIFPWNTIPYPSGTYYCIIRSKNISETLNIIIMK